MIIDDPRSARPGPPITAPDAFETLDDVLTDSLSRLTEAVKDRRKPFHTPTLATIGEDGWPAARTVVLRAFSVDERVLRFHSDRRAGKVRELAACERAAVHLYDPAAKIQLRLTGVATVHTGDDIAEAAWAGTRLFSRRCYLTELAPGEQTEALLPGLPADLQHRSPEAAESEAGYANFTVIGFRFDRLDWLYLTAAGNQRAGFLWDHAGAAHSSWLAP